MLAFPSVIGAAGSRSSSDSLGDVFFLIGLIVTHPFFCVTVLVGLGYCLLSIWSDPSSREKYSPDPWQNWWVGAIATVGAIGGWIWEATMLGNPDAGDTKRAVQWVLIKIVLVATAAQTWYAVATPKSRRGYYVSAALWIPTAIVVVVICVLEALN